MNISNKAASKVNAGILVSGSARSGTTITGKIIHSLAGVEYVFELPVLYDVATLFRTENV